MGKIDKLVKNFLAQPSDARFEDVRYVLEAFGYKEIRARGSHHTFENARGEVIVVPKKGGQKVKRVYIQRIVELLNLEDWQNG